MNLLPHIRKRSFWEWVVMLLIGVTIFAIILTPVWVINEQHNETERVIAELERNADERLAESIQVNVLTITCILAIPPEERNVMNMTECINDGFAATDIPAPTDPIPPGS